MHFHFQWYDLDILIHMYVLPDGHFQLNRTITIYLPYPVTCCSIELFTTVIIKMDNVVNTLRISDLWVSGSNAWQATGSYVVGTSKYIWYAILIHNIFIHWMWQWSNQQPQHRYRKHNWTKVCASYGVQMTPGVWWNSCDVYAICVTPDTIFYCISTHLGQI